MNAMKRAHEIRREAAVRWNCKVSEIVWSECLKMAHAGQSVPKKMETITITAKDANGVALIIENREFRFHRNSDGLTDKETGRLMSLYCGEYGIAKEKGFGRDEVLDAMKIERFNSFRKEAQRLVYESKKEVEAAKKPEVVVESKEIGVCPKCHTFCYGDC